MFRKNVIPQVFINTNIYKYQILLIKYPKQFLHWDVDAGLEKNATWYQFTIKIKISHKINIPIICRPQPTNFSKQKVTLAVYLFNEIIAALNLQSSAETARFITLVLRMLK